MLRLKHAVLLGREIVVSARTHRVRGLVPMMVLLAVVGVARSATSAALPVAVHTLV